MSWKKRASDPKELLRLVFSYMAHQDYKNFVNFVLGSLTDEQMVHLADEVVGDSKAGADWLRGNREIGEAIQQYEGEGIEHGIS